MPFMMMGSGDNGLYTKWNDEQVKNRVGTVLFIVLLLDIFHIVKVNWFILFVLYLIYG